MGLLTDCLTERSEQAYKSFSKKLTPDTKYKMLGVRVPIIRDIARNYCKNGELVTSFLLEKHTFFEEYLLHGFLIAYSKFDLDKTVLEIEKFLPYIDNWAICDSFCASLKIVKKNKHFFFRNIKKWLQSSYPYTVRVALVLLLFHYTDKDWTDDIIQLTKSITSTCYYVNMALAWLYSVLLVKDFDKAIILLESKTLPRFVQNKTIQKAKESFRIAQPQKEYLNSLKV